MKLTDHFTLDELTTSQEAVRRGIDNIPNEEVIRNLTTLATALELIRTELGDHSLNISSGYRCLSLNRAIGSGDTSAHVAGLAADFTCSKYGTPRNVAEKLVWSGIKFDQIILEGVSEQYPDGAWCHISVDPKMRRQVLTMKRMSGRTVYEKGLT